jgi:hypothetical protein
VSTLTTGTWTAEASTSSCRNMVFPAARTAERCAVDGELTEGQMDRTDAALVAHADAGASMGDPRSSTSARNPARPADSNGGRPMRRPGGHGHHRVHQPPVASTARLQSVKASGMAHTSRHASMGTKRDTTCGHGDQEALRKRSQSVPRPSGLPFPASQIRPAAVCNVRNPPPIRAQPEHNFLSQCAT